ncbi:MAG: hypothetical protein ACLPUH_02010 [Steroidobacteraceae bacterium]
MKAVVADDRDGKAVLQLFYETNQSRIIEISRVDEKGVIRDDFPDINAVGLDISHQKHVVALMRDHKPVISEVFRTIEGVDSIALHDLNPITITSASRLLAARRIPSAGSSKSATN